MPYCLVIFSSASSYLEQWSPGRRHKKASIVDALTPKELRKVKQRSDFVHKLDRKSKHSSKSHAWPSLINPPTRNSLRWATDTDQNYLREPRSSGFVDHATI
ncbi:hypothetical protein JTE90_000214 [Oedothorax gibbosus]|uniref:Uncharacterized protein n=1 Tax=Oedothorax gibbosus TaxID=931172 RepID=A0AAV6VC22_9ARAC|nr:hypothetical protein JTE90_000214 [Oedothorax gibbosus]